MKKYLFLFIVFLFPKMLFAQAITKITSQEAQSMLGSLYGKNAVIIDGRTSAMFESEHLKNAVNINAFSEEADDKLRDYLDREKILVYCTNRNRSETMISKLQALGYKGEIIFVTDGINGWKKNGFPVVTDTGIHASESGANDTQKPMAKLNPVVQVFGIAAYDIENNRYGYRFGRAHLGFQYQFNKAWSAKMIIDRGRPTMIDDIVVRDSAGNMLNVDYTSNEGGYYTMWLKFASLRWQVNDKVSFIGGALLQNHYITQERFWGLRYVAQTFQDLHWHIPSTDLGFRANYKLNDVFAIDAALTNGEGPRIKQDAFGKVKYAAGLDMTPGDRFSARVYYHNKTTGIDSLSEEQMFSVFAGYKISNVFRVGGEFNYMDNLYNRDGTDSYGFSVYSIYHIAKSTELFVRYDHLLYDSKNVLPIAMANGNTLIGGLSYSPVKEVNLSVNYQGWMSDGENNRDENNILLNMEYKF
ncbi:MAG: rhodanese-like domain-containing protein [bacterium]